MSHLPRISLIVCCLIFFTISYAQQALVFNRFTINEGLNTNKIKCTWQDEKGFVWVGTENGLQRFDGRKFVQFTIMDPATRLPPAGVDEILDSGNQKMWLRQGTTMGRYDRRNFTWQK